MFSQLFIFWGTIHLLNMQYDLDSQWHISCIQWLLLTKGHLIGHPLICLLWPADNVKVTQQPGSVWPLCLSGSYLSSCEHSDFRDQGNWVNEYVAWWPSHRQLSCSGGHRIGSCHVVKSATHLEIGHFSSMCTIFQCVAVTWHKAEHHDSCAGMIMGNMSYSVNVI